MGRSNEVYHSSGEADQLLKRGVRERALYKK